jgi:hypothetical protein
MLFLKDPKITKRIMQTLPSLARLQSNEETFKDIFGSDSDSDNHDDDKTVLEIKCNQKVLSKLSHAIIKRESLIIADEKENIFVIQGNLNKYYAIL